MQTDLALSFLLPALCRWDAVPLVSLTWDAVTRALASYLVFWEVIGFFPFFFLNNKLFLKRGRGSCDVFPPG